MIYSQVFVFFNIISLIFYLNLDFDDKYFKLAELPWDIIINISTISLINELKKYFVTFDFITFLGFNKLFSSRFKKFTNFNTFLIKITCILLLLLTFVRTLMRFINDSCLQLFDNLVYIFLSIRIIFL